MPSADDVFRAWRNLTLAHVRDLPTRNAQITALGKRARRLRVRGGRPPGGGPSAPAGAAGMVILPTNFTATHNTDGLPGYPAVDVFGAPGAQVRPQFSGTVRRLSGRPCAEGGESGGAYGRSIYVAEPGGNDRFLTHFDLVYVDVGDHVGPLTILGTICNSAVSGKPGTSHIHMGLHRG